MAGMAMVRNRVALLIVSWISLSAVLGRIVSLYCGVGLPSSCEEELETAEHPRTRGWTDHVTEMKPGGPETSSFPPRPCSV